VQIGAGPERVVEAVSQVFGLRLTALEPVTAGADALARVWRGPDRDSGSWAVKLTRGGSVAGLLVPAHLAAVGVRGVPAPLCAGDGRPWATWTAPACPSPPG
jgi:spectinomycin phosphotransferase